MSDKVLLKVPYFKQVNENACGAERWQCTGDNVTGGVAISIAERVLDLGLAPDLPNSWAALHG
jgi:hypothetical protein